jgi:quinohemoprotein ethanol dehydrogenase
VPGIRYQDGTAFEMWPSPRGAHSWMPMAFSPQTGLVYIPRLSQGLTFDSRGIDAGKNLRVIGTNIGAPKPNPLDETSALIAWNPVTQKLVWEVRTFGGWNGGVLATGGDLVFQGQINGRFSAYEARHGKELWHFAAQDALLAAPISYMVGGKQYVSVVVGMTGTAAIDPRSLGGLIFDYRTQKRRVLTFALDSNTELPPAPPPVIQAAPDPDYKADAALAAKGAANFGFNCGICHGPEAVSGGTAPDLRSSDIPSAADIFHAVVHDGARVAEGMPSFKDLSESDIAAIRQYIRSRAADLRAGATIGP